MVAANADKSIESENISFVNTQSREANFEAKCKAVTLKTTANVYIAFDRPANTGDFLLEAADRVVTLEVPTEFTKVSALGASGSGTLYILVRR